jgi:hypothetical protein
MHFLLAGEGDASSGSMRDALWIGDALASRGHKITYAMPDIVAFLEWTGGALPAPAVVTTPALREPPQLIMKRRPPSGFDDLMAITGFANLGHLRSLASVMRRQLALLKPDAIVGFQSPVVWLIGNTVAPTFAIGCGVNIPPRLGDGFPRLSATAAPLAADEVMLSNANTIRAELGAGELTALSEVLSQCTEILYGLPMLDPYLSLRKQKTMGVLAKTGGLTPLPAKRRIAAILDVHCPNIEALLLAIAASSEIEFDLHLHGGTAGMRRYLQQHPNVSLVDSLDHIYRNFERISALLHHGDADLLEAGLRTGRQQLVLPFLPEHHLIAGTISWVGSVQTFTPAPSIADNGARIESFIKDASLAVNAQHHARQLAANGIDDALPAIIATLETAAPMQSSARQVREAASEPVSRVSSMS